LSKKKFKFIDLFAGIGGFHIGMHENGGKCVFASEIDKFARVTYEENFRSISSEIFTKNDFNKDITDPDLEYSKIPNFDVLCAGFPCQPFSHAGLKKGFDDTRGTLFFNIKEIVRLKLEGNKIDSRISIPKVLFLENVKGFRNHDKGRTYKVLQKTLKDLGYQVQSEVLNSKHFGLPQNRERIFIIAWHKESVPVETFKFPFGIDESDNIIYDKDIRNKICKNINVGSILLSKKELNILEKEADKSYTISQKLWDGHQRRKREHGLKGNGFGYSSFNKNSSYTSTISARYYKDGSEILIEPNPKAVVKRPRKLHPIEAARLQGYPIDSWYKIPVSDNQAYKQFGNSVSVPVIQAISKEILTQLLEINA
jgi:DNA (cytosine-5)-methyltransferase 1